MSSIFNACSSGQFITLDFEVDLIRPNEGVENILQQAAHVFKNCYIQENLVDGCHLIAPEEKSKNKSEASFLEGRSKTKVSLLENHSSKNVKSVPRLDGGNSNEVKTDAVLQEPSKLEKTSPSNERISQIPSQLLSSAGGNEGDHSDLKATIQNLLKEENDIGSHLNFGESNCRTMHVDENQMKNLEISSTKTIGKTEVLSDITVEHNRKVNNNKSEKRQRNYAFRMDESGNRYEGEYYRGKKDGRGSILYAATKDKYVGDWRDDKPHGTGIYVYSDGCGEFKGRWKHGKLVSVKQGFAKVTDDYDNRYRGTFVNGKKHGSGMLMKPNGEKYIGGWKDGVKHGYGLIEYPDGSVLKGLFDSGTPVNVQREKAERPKLLIDIDSEISSDQEKEVENNVLSILRTRSESSKAKDIKKKSNSFSVSSYDEKAIHVNQSSSFSSPVQSRMRQKSMSQLSASAENGRGGSSSPPRGSKSSLRRTRSESCRSKDSKKSSSSSVASSNSEKAVRVNRISSSPSSTPSRRRLKKSMSQQKSGFSEKSTFASSSSAAGSKWEENIAATTTTKKTGRNIGVSSMKYSFEDLD